MIWVNTTFQTHFGTGKSFQQQLIIEQEINEFECICIFYFFIFYVSILHSRSLRVWGMCHYIMYLSYTYVHKDVPRAQSPGLYAVSIDVVKLSNVRVTDYLLIQPPRKQLKDVSINESKVHQQGNNVNNIRTFANYAQLNFQISNPNGKSDTCTSIMVKVVPILKQFQVFIQSVLDADTSSHFNDVTTQGQMCLHSFRLDHLEMHISKHLVLIGETITEERHGANGAHQLITNEKGYSRVYRDRKERVHRAI
ncbi:hypothetical protein RFI_35605, partial [Reticulomyxa filosa]